MKKYEELENKIKELQEEVDKLKKEEKSGRFKPDINESYWYMNSIGSVRKTKRTNSYADYHIKTRNCFRTEKEVKHYKKLKDIHYTIMDIADELGTPTEEDYYNDNINIYYLYIDCRHKKIFQDYNLWSICQGSINCLDENFVDVCIERIGEDNLKDYLMNWRG